jgi:hypothetical protein
MPFDLHIARAAGSSGLLGRMLGSRSTPITADELHAVMRGAPATPYGEHAYRVTHPDGDPWFVASWNDGTVTLSTSYSNHRYLRNFPDMCDQALRIAAGLKASVREEVEGKTLTTSNIDAVLAPTGSYVALQARTWRGAMEQTRSEARAPLEYPLGQIDLVPEYLVFHVTPSQGIDDEAVERVARDIDAVTVTRAHAGAWLVGDSVEPRGLTRILRRPDGTWQIWPAWGEAPFARIAEVTTTVAEQLAAVGQGDVKLCGLTYDGALRDDVRSRIDGLGVDFHVWMSARQSPR